MQNSETLIVVPSKKNRSLKNNIHVAVRLKPFINPNNSICQKVESDENTNHIDRQRIWRIRND